MLALARARKAKNTLVPVYKDENMNKIKSLFKRHYKKLIATFSMLLFLIISLAVIHEIFYDWLHDGPLSGVMTKIHHFESDVLKIQDHRPHHEHQ